MTFESPMTFVEAVRHLVSQGLMPTSMSSGELRQVDAGIRRQSLFSARTLNEDLLGRYKDVIGSILEPKEVSRELADGTTKQVIEGHNPATARAEIKRLLGEMGYEPEEGMEGTIRDLGSDARINLVVKTNVELAQGAGKFVQGNANEDVVDLWPAWELVRYEERSTPRNWEQRWRIAAAVAGDAKALACLEGDGRMCALKSSGIWQALGDGEGGFTDTLGNPYPPFAFNSGMWCDDVSRDEAVEMGLIGEGETAEPAEFDFQSLFGTAE